MSTCKDNSQPFPSPGSSFIPPPVPGPHEFALPIPRKMSKKDLVDNRTSTPSHNGVVSQTRAFSPLTFLTSLVPRFIVSILNMPRSIWRVLPFQDPPPPDPLSDPPDPLPDLPLSLPHPSHNRLSTQSVTSLTSSRPAPPSPAVSRRQSGLSRASSRPVSDMSSRPPSGAHTSHPASRPTSGTVVSLAVMTATTRHLLNPTPPATAVPSASTPVLIYIRDYGFEPTDPRFTGQGPLVPRVNRPTVLARRLAGSSASTPTSTTTDDADEDDEWEDDDRTGIDAVQSMWEQVVDDGTNGWGGFKWGFGHGWGLGPDSTATTSSPAFPSRGDLDRNFGAEDDDMEVHEDGEVFSEGEPDAENEPPLFPGLYRAVYAFDPEGTAEMKLDEDQLVRVIGRGGGVGWAVVAKDGLGDTGAHALVPESYLEVVRLDGEEDPER
ncbi:hypothetical protein JVU11DRAFT_10126 [Chiua virens]|nr:hypothetical protein JVU11DRAFT_10126 [Chiua virens]